jgi:hypothetical protein
MSTNSPRPAPEPKSSAWACECGRLNAPYRKACTACGAPRDKREERTA